MTEIVSAKKLKALVKVTPHSAAQNIFQGNKIWRNTSFISSECFSNKHNKYLRVKPHFDPQKDTQYPSSI